MGCHCHKCGKISASLFLLLGIAYLIADLSTSWDFWGISWWTAVLLVVGVTHFAMSHCKDCQSISSGSSKKSNGKK